MNTTNSSLRHSAVIRLRVLTDCNALCIDRSMPYIVDRHVLRVAKRATTVDLRQSIEKRLMAFRVERRRLQTRLALVIEIEKEYELLLAEADQMTLSAKIDESGTAKLSEIVKAEEDEESTNAKLKEFLLAQLEHEPRALDDLVHLALNGGFNFGTKSPARVLHFNLLNLKNSGLLEKEGDKWKSARNQTA
jgi:hypothetical protein